MINALKRKPTTRPGVMVSGGSYQGKAESVCDVLARFEEAWLDLHHHLNPAAIASMGRPPNVRPYNLHRTRWIRRYHANMSECSEGFRRAVARVLPEAEQPQH
ncbi:hypothetical protein GCM10010404_93470 [Nonomuraea africana]|uniref:Uncharacterized protein n=2 Tax=Nonomuraea africana TaxID=46171 RepID=A0ABR9KC87_9ACTN|nr:hypothetical protein [Nonomuraea africana]MBE1559625.1 hypothetical protein [Nonomuraea africana]